ncbi:MAG: AEC family transporter [Spirochaetota bacterium]|nr:MAG: AEC family transporter [Spirochaetota bacterium]
MSGLFRIFTHVIFPVLFVIATGFFLQKKFKFDFATLTKPLFYVLSPCLIFTRVYEAPLPLRQYGLFTLFTIGLIAVMGALAFGVSMFRGFTPSMRSAFILSIMLANLGNYGIPVIELLFNDSYATSIQVMVMISQGIITFTFGMFFASRGQLTFKESVKRTLSYPIIYAIIVSFIFKGFQIPIWEPMWITMQRISYAFIPIALFTLGAQLGRIHLTKGMGDVIISAGCRLILGPCIGFCLIKLFNFHGLVAQVLFISSSLPSAVNSALVAVEMNNEPKFASQAVFFSTLLSFATVSLTIFVAKNWGALL